MIMEIKFRGIDRFTGQMRYGDLAHNKGISSNVGEDLYDRVMVGGYEVKSETVGQYIRRKDKNGVEIYDGDFISLTSSSGEIIIHQVHISEKGLSTELRNIERTDPWNQFSHIRNEWWEDFKNDISVIGNIYDNPELLKE